MRKNIKLLLADDHNLFRAGIIKLLNEQENIIVIGEASNGNELFSKYFELSPDVILVDIAMPEMSGPEAVSRINKQDPGVKALFLSMYEGEEYIYRVLKSGGYGLINKSIMEDELVKAIEIVSEGKKYFEDNWNEDSLSKLIEEFESGKKSSIDQKTIKLNYREEQIIKLLSDGLSSTEMADKLNLSKKTVDFYRSCLMKKLNLKAPADLIRFAVQKYSFEGSVQNHS